MGKERKRGGYEQPKINLPSALEISPLLVRSQAIRLANQALSKTFPDYFNKVPPLRNEVDVIVVKDRSSSAHYQKMMTEGTHSLRHELAKGIAKRDPKNLTQFSDKEAQALNITDRDIANHPILILESEITDTKNTNLPEEIKKALLEVSIGKILLHEAVHHYVKPHKEVKVDSSDPLFGMTFAYDRLTSKKHPELTNELQKFAAENDPSVQIGATKIRLYCNDKDGKRRVMTESGYDFEEAFVEIITNKASQYLIEYTKENYGSLLAMHFKELFEKDFKSDGNYRLGNITKVVVPYLATLGIRNFDEALPAFMDGEIPLMHARIHGKKEYLP